MLQIRVFLAAILATLSAPLFAHDTWVQANTQLVRVADNIHIDLCLGNHGNHHRDFRYASKIDLTGCKVVLHAPADKSYDLMPDLVDLGYAPKEGFFSARYTVAAPGMYMVEHTVDKVVNHGEPSRSIKSAKTFFVASHSLDKVKDDQTGFDQVLGHPLELVPVKNPVLPMGPEESIKVKLLLKGKPFSDQVVSFIPRSLRLKEGFDPDYERKTDADGIASFTPKFGDYYLIVAHHTDANEKAAEYVKTGYSATITLYVPELCPCCE